MARFLKKVLEVKIESLAIDCDDLRLSDQHVIKLNLADFASRAYSQHLICLKVANNHPLSLMWVNFCNQLVQGILRNFVIIMAAKT